MSEKLIATIIICVTVAFVAIIGGLVAIAVLKGDGSEAQIVTMMIGLPTALMLAAGPIVQHWIQNNSNKGATNNGTGSTH